MLSSLATSKNMKETQSHRTRGVLRTIIVFLVLLAVFTTCEVTGAVSLIVDQSHRNYINSWHNLSYYRFDQEFIPSFQEIDIVVLEIFTDDGAEMMVHIRRGSFNGPVVGTSDVLTLVGGDSTKAHFVFEPFVTLNSDDVYVIDLVLIGGSAFIASSFEDGGYPEGKMYINDSHSPTDRSDVLFQTGILQPDMIDIRARGGDECINVNSAGNLEVVINSSDILDASMIDPATMSLDGASVRRAGGTGRYLCREKYANGDELPDLVCQITMERQMTGKEEHTLSLEAETFDGLSLYGEDTLCIVGY